MTTINFFLEERGLIEQLKNVKKTNAVVESLVLAMEKICYSSLCLLHIPKDFYSFQVDGKTLAQWMFGTEQDGDIRDLLLRLAIVIDRSATCEIDGDLEGVGIASLCRDGMGGLISQNTFAKAEWWDEKKMKKVSVPIDVIYALRELYSLAKIPVDLFPIYCEEMFENLYFHVSPSDIKKMGLGYEDIVKDIITHFSYLNDAAQLDFEECRQNDIIIKRASAYGVNISPEGPLTHKDRAAMKERDISICGEIICCEWHTKLTATRGRIHFFPWRHRSKEVKKITKEKVIVGIIASHLS